MKATLSFLLATFFATSAFAAYDEGRLTVTVAQGKNIQVQIDGRSYSDDDNTITVQNIQSGYHTIKIFRSNGRNNNNNNGRWDRGNNRAQEVIYSSQVYVRPSYHVDVMVNRFGKALVDEQIIDRNYNNNGGYDDYRNGGYNNGYRQAMNDNDFNQLVGKIKSQWFGNGKMKTARESIPQYYFNTTQVRQLLQIFSSENDKLELAKLAYANTVDPRNYSSLYDVFAYQSSRDELERYVRNYR